jgi:hypothetical protein
MNKIFLIMLWGGLINYCCAMESVVFESESKKGVIKINLDDFNLDSLEDFILSESESEDSFDAKAVQSPDIYIIKNRLKPGLSYSLKVARKWFGSRKTKISCHKYIAKKKFSKYFEHYVYLDNKKFNCLFPDEKDFYYSYFIDVRLPLLIRDFKGVYGNQTLEEISLILTDFFYSLDLNYLKKFMVVNFERDFYFKEFIIRLIKGFFSEFFTLEVSELPSTEGLKLFLKKCIHDQFYFEETCFYCEEFQFMIKINQKIPQDLIDFILYFLRFLTVHDNGQFLTEEKNINYNEIIYKVFVKSEDYN